MTPLLASGLRTCKRCVSTGRTWVELVCVGRLLPTGKLVGLFFTTENAISADGLCCCAELYHNTVDSTGSRMSPEAALCQWHYFEPCLAQILQLLLWAYCPCVAGRLPVYHTNLPYWLPARYVYLVYCAV